MCNNDILRVLSYIVEKLGTRCIFMLLNITYILPLFLTRFIGVFKMVQKTPISTYLRLVLTNNKSEWLFHICVKFESTEYILRLRPRTLFRSIYYTKSRTLTALSNFREFLTKYRFPGISKYDF